MDKKMQTDANIHYDAFISYKHDTKDAFVAQKLHRMLEHYRIPKKIRNRIGKRRISRVFRDREELPLSADLAENIREALAHAEFLIVVCSPAAVQSVWVQREIETFLQYHSKEQVLTLLVDGEPEEAFPEVLCNREEILTLENGEKATVQVPTEPPAADVRGKSQAETERKLKQEFLRILAPMLSCTYDELKQRHREYTTRRILISLSVGLGLALSFMGYAFWQTARINKQYHEVRRNQARYLSQISGELLESGDRMGALKTALAITDGNENPVVPEQMYALNSALYSYRNPDTLELLPDTMYEMDGLAIQQGEFSPDGEFYFCMDQTGIAYLLESSNGECYWKLEAEKITGIESSVFLYGKILVEEHAALLSDYGIVYLDIKEKKVRKVIRINEGNLPVPLSSGSVEYAAVGELFAMANSSEVWIYNLESGECVRRVQYMDPEKAYNYSISDIALQPSGTQIAIGMSSYSERSAKKRRGLCLISIETGDVQLLSSENTQKVLFLDDCRVAAVQYHYAINKNDDLAEAEEYFYCISVYDSMTGQNVWSGEEISIFSMHPYVCAHSLEMILDDQKQEILAVVIKNQLFLLKPKTGEMIQKRDYTSDIVNVERYDNERLLVGLQDGRILISTLDYMMTIIQVGSIQAETISFAYESNCGLSIQGVSGSRNLVFSCLPSGDDVIELKTRMSQGAVDYFAVLLDDGEIRRYRCATYSFNSVGTPQMIVWECGSSREVYRIMKEDEDDYLMEFKIGACLGRPALCYYISNYKKNKKKLYIVDLETRQEVFSKNYHETLDGSSWDICFTSSLKKIVFYEGAYKDARFLTLEITQNGVSEPKAENEWIHLENIDTVKMSADDRYLLIMAGDYGDYGLKIWDMEQKEWLDTDEVGNIRIENENCIVMGKQSSVSAVYTKKGTIEIIDLPTGSILCTIPFKGGEEWSFDFLDDEKYLLTCGDSNYLTLWDAQEGKILMKDSKVREFGVDVYTDGSNRYFGLKNSGFWADDGGMNNQELEIYYLDDAQRFYHYADVPYGYASFEGNEILCDRGSGNLYYTAFHSFAELKEKAEVLLKGEGLTEEEKRKYFISE